jgi:hypothetical protein
MIKAPWCPWFSPEPHGAIDYRPGTQRSAAVVHPGLVPFAGVAIKEGSSCRSCHGAGQFSKTTQSPGKTGLIGPGLFVADFDIPITHPEI